MTKQEFITALRNGLYGLPQEDIEERVNFYCEMIDDRVEDGVSESDAISEIGDVKNIVSQILMETPLTKMVKEKVKPKSAIRTWELVLLVLGSPIWLSLLVAALVVILSLYISVWSIVISLWAVFGSLVGWFIGDVVSGIAMAVCSNTFSGLFSLSAGLVCGGLAIFMFFGCKSISHGMVFITKKTALGIKRLFLGKESGK